MRRTRLAAPGKASVPMTSAMSALPYYSPVAPSTLFAVPWLASSAIRDAGHWAVYEHWQSASPDGRETRATGRR
jgi:hypothetical protein